MSQVEQHQPHQAKGSQRGGREKKGGEATRDRRGTKNDTGRQGDWYGNLESQMPRLDAVDAANLGKIV